MLRAGTPGTACGHSECDCRYTNAKLRSYKDSRASRVTQSACTVACDTMGPRQRAVTSVGGVVVLCGAAGAGLFVLTGETVIVWLTLLGLPVSIVAGTVVYVRLVITGSRSNEQALVEQHSQAVAASLQDVIRTINERQQKFNDWSPAINDQRDSIVADARAQGISCDPDTGSVEPTTAVRDADLQQLDRLAVEIDQFSDTVDDMFREFVRSRLDQIEQAEDKLERAGLAEQSSPAALPEREATVTAWRDALVDRREDAADTLTTAIGAVRDLTANLPAAETDPLEQRLEQATRAVNNNEYQDAAEDVIELRRRLRDQLSDPFKQERARVSELAETVLQSPADRYVDESQIAAVRSVQQATESLDSALEVTDLSAQQARLRQTSVEIVRRLEQTLVDTVDSLQTASLPEEQYTIPAVVEDDLTADLEQTSELDQFREAWRESVGRLVDALEKTQSAVATADAYDGVADRISAELRQSGELSAADLTVENPERVLELYSRRNAGTEFVPEARTLRLTNREEHTLTVNVEYTRGDAPKMSMSTIRLIGDDYATAATVRAQAAGSTEFTGVPTGRYTITASPGTDEFSAVEREIHVDDDRTVGIEFAEQTAQE